MSDIPIEQDPYLTQLVGAITERISQLGEAGNHGDADLLWRCHRAIKAMRLELAQLRLTHALCDLRNL